ncbi:hypothetical protein P4Z30_000445 [Salmonella enterica]|nr:hypothetical protein [Salmonella enterica]
MRDSFYPSFSGVPATTSQSEQHQQVQQKALQEQLVPVVPDIRLVPDNTATKTCPYFRMSFPALTSLMLIFRDATFFLTGFLFLHFWANLKIFVRRL